MAQAGPLDELQRARVDLVRGQIAFTVSRGVDAPPLLLERRPRLRRSTSARARDVPRRAQRGVVRGAPQRGLGPARRRPRAVPLSPASVRPTPSSRARRCSSPTGRRRGAADAARADGVPRRARCPPTSGCAGCCSRAAPRTTSGTPSTGTRSRPSSSSSRATPARPACSRTRWHARGRADVRGRAERRGVARRRGGGLYKATGIDRPSYPGVWVAAWQGREAEVRARVDANDGPATQVGEGQWLTLVHWASALLYNGLAATRRRCARPSSPSARRSSTRSRAGRFPSWSRPRSAAGATTPRRRRSRACRRSRSRAAPTGASGSRRSRARC